MGDSDQKSPWICVHNLEIVCVKVDHLWRSISGANEGLIQVDPKLHTQLPVVRSTRKPDEIVDARFSCVASCLLDPHKVELEVRHLSAEVM